MVQMDSKFFSQFERKLKGKFKIQRNPSNFCFHVSRSYLDTCLPSSHSKLGAQAPRTSSHLVWSCPFILVSTDVQWKISNKICCERYIGFSGTSPPSSGGISYAYIRPIRPKLSSTFWRNNSTFENSRFNIFYKLFQHLK